MAYKMALVVRTDLGMGKGKMVTQGGHAVASLIWLNNHLLGGTENVNAWWEDSPPQKKVTLKVSSEQEIKDLAERCQESGLIHIIVRDAGLTQVEPGTITALGIGPNMDERIDSIVGGLKLL